MNHAGVYLHTPFCRSRCSYCDFATGMYESDLAERYVNSLIEEIKRWNEVDHPADVNTIYFGGGTPSLLAPAQIERILKAVRDRFQVLTGAEVTIELNPGDGGTSAAAKLETIRDFQHLGINRASFGAQTFDDRELKQLGRTHSSDDITSTFYQLREAGFENINFDLIAGLPRQTMADWQRNLAAALKPRPEHLSLYLLDVHEGTPLADQIKRGMRPEPDDDLAAEMYLMLIDELCAVGYEHYEISNFCRPGFESRHNTKYWSGDPYYGFGCSAHSYDGARRRWCNERDMAKYPDLIEHHQSPIVERTVLNEEDARSESIFLGLRLMRGLDLMKYQSRFGSNLKDEYDSDLVRLRDAGLVEIDREVLRLTKRGALLSNEVFAALA
ncbi:MAG TPA: radical SAM family heme chaperone HemW [Pyrinomonadaceae bacterium]|nr:radical SAM family heme chaperone HemW [Pyrinomonadaceae bacterium]